MNGRNNLLHLYVGIFLVSAAILSFQIGLTRIFSISQWYHFAFMAVSLAFLGFGASGSFLAIFRVNLRSKIEKKLSLISTLFSLAVIASFTIINKLPYDSFLVGIDNVQFFYLSVYYVSLAVPFFLGGLIIAILLDNFPEKVNVLYFYNLIGSGVGSILVVVIPFFTDETGLIFFVALIGLIVAISFGYQLSKYYLTILSIVSIFLVFILTHVPNFFEITISQYKTLSSVLRFPDAETLTTKRNAFSRVDVIRSGAVRYAPGMTYLYPDTLPNQIGITVDGENLNGITGFDGILEKVDFTDFLPSALGYKLGSDQKVLIINPRGGLNVLSGIYHNAKSITVVEDNRLIVELMKDEFSDFNGSIYRRPNINVVEEMGRSFVRRSNDKFDQIIISLTDSFGAVASGAFSLSENYLYTVEAFEDYFTSLSDHGIITVTRWLQIPPSESLKIGSAIITALENMKLENPKDHIVFIRTWNVGTFLIKKQPFTDSELNAVRTFCKERLFDIVFLPDVRESEVNVNTVFDQPQYYKSFSKLMNREERENFYQDYIFDITPTRDNRPFFFHFFKWSQVPPILENLGKEWKPFAGSGYLVVILILIIATTTSVFLILFPLRYYKLKQAKFAGRWKLMTYFSCLGVGFLFVEIPLLHQFILFLGHPTYSFAAVFSSILIFSGIGSLTSRTLESNKIFKIVLVILSLLILFYLFLVPRLIDIFLGETFLARFVISILILAPLAFLMGMPFPMGIRKVSQLAPEFIPWVWAVNGCFSVLSSIVAIMIALSWGYSVVLGCAGAVYFVGMVALWEEV